MEDFYLANANRYRNLVSALSGNAGTGTAPTTANRPDPANQPDIVVAARIRPLLPVDVAAGFPRAVFVRQSDSNTLDIHDLYNYPWGKPILKSTSHEVDRIFDSDATTKEVYEDVVKPSLSCVLDGAGTVTIFAYGQTGSGKTYTIGQLEELIAKSLTEQDLGKGKEIHISVIDLAGNSAYDLLDSRKPVSLLQDSRGVTQWAGAGEHPIQTCDELLELIKRAQSFRTTASTQKNDESSRSHAICRIRIGKRYQDADKDGLLYLVDLAGSEFAQNVSGHGADRMRETRQINISLSALKDCIRAKGERAAQENAENPNVSTIGRRPAPRIPYRQSALTRVLRHVFEPDTERVNKTVVFACVNPSLADAVASKVSMRYAEMLLVKGPASATRPRQ